MYIISTIDVLSSLFHRAHSVAVSLVVQWMTVTEDSTGHTALDFPGDHQL